MTLEPDSAHERIAISARDLATGAVLWDETWPKDEDQTAAAEALVVSAGVVAVLGRWVPAAGVKHDALVVAFDVRTGQRLWDATFEHADEYETFKTGLAKGRRLVAGGYVIEDGRFDELLVAYDIRTGSELWSSVLSLPGDQYLTALGLAGSRVIVVGGDVSRGDPALRAVHIRSGVTLWDESFDLDLNLMVLSLGTSKSRLVLATSAGIFGLDARSGKRVWESDLWGYCAAISGGAAIVGGGYTEEGGPAARGFVAR
jgi:outer membrane protein assembly factor BamB